MPLVGLSASASEVRAVRASVLRQFPDHYERREIQSATSTLNRYTPEYVREANKALVESNHPDAERLVGIGLRLQTAIDSLDNWANTNPEDSEQ